MTEPQYIEDVRKIAAEMGYDPQNEYFSDDIADIWIDYMDAGLSAREAVELELGA